MEATYSKKCVEHNQDAECIEVHTLMLYFFWICIWIEIANKIKSRSIYIRLYALKENHLLCQLLCIFNITSSVFIMVHRWCYYLSLVSLSVCPLKICYSCHHVPEGIINICSNDGDADHFPTSSHFSSPPSLSVCMTFPLVESGRLQSFNTYLPKKHFVNAASMECTVLKYNFEWWAHDGSS